MIWTGPNDAPLTTKEERMDELRNARTNEGNAELIARLRKLAIFDPDLGYAANLIEQQAKELVEAQARVVELTKEFEDIRYELIEDGRFPNTVAEINQALAKFNKANNG